MDIDFSIGSIPAKLTRGWFWGGVKIETPDESRWVQYPLHPLTHFSFRLQDKWTGTVAGQTVTVEKRRPLWVAGARPQSIKVFVGGELVAEKHGY